MVFFIGFKPWPKYILSFSFRHVLLEKRIGKKDEWKTILRIGNV